MNILQGLIPSQATKIAAAALARLPKRTPPSPAAAVIRPLNRPQPAHDLAELDVPPPPTLTRQAAAVRYLAQNPTAKRTKVAAICGCSVATVDAARSILRRRGTQPAPPPKYWAVDVAEAAILKQPKATRAEIAKLCKCSLATVDNARRRLKMRGVQLPRRVPAIDAIGVRLLDLLRQHGNLTPQEIGTRLNLTPPRVYWVLQREREAGRLKSAQVWIHEVIE